MRRRLTPRIVFWASPACLAGLPAFAGNLPEDPNAVAAAVQKSVAATIPADAAITLGNVLGAQYMQSCGVPLAVTITGNPPYEQASAHCARPAWTLYVSVTIAEMESVAVTAHPIAAGTPLNPSDLKLAPEPVSLFAGRQVYFNTADLAGAVPLVSLGQNTILTAAGISQPVIVQAGQSAAVTVRSAGLSLSITAIADEPGHAGDTILMTNPATGQRFHASVTRSGLLIDLN